MNFRFAIVSDLHIALPHTLWDHPTRFHLVEVSIPALEQVLEHLQHLDLDFLLLPGDLTQHGEPENHAWLRDRLAQLPFPTYVIPGNHDVPIPEADGRSIGWAEFPHYYPKQGYDNPEQLYYTCELLPGLRLIALNSNQFDTDGNQIGWVDDAQLAWLQQVLEDYSGDRILVMIHHNLLEHLPNQSQHPLGRRYMLGNAPTVCQLLQSAGVQLVFTGHLHMQDVAQQNGLYDITTGSLVSYPHPYRILQFRTDDHGQATLQIESHRIDAVPDFPNLQQHSRDWMGDRSLPLTLKLLTSPPLNLTPDVAAPLATQLRYLWADTFQGDTVLQFPDFPPTVRAYFEAFSAIAPIDNHTTLTL